MGLMDSLSMLAQQLPGQAIAQQTATLQGQTAGRTLAQQLAEKAQMQQRQIAQDALEADYKRQQMDHLRAQTDTLQHPEEKPYEWDTKEDEAGNYFQVDPRSGKTRPVMQANGKPARAPARKSGDGTSGLSPYQQMMQEQKTFNRSQSLQADFKNNPNVAKAYGVAGAVAGIKSALRGETAMDDLSLIYETVKLFDPNSAVREGEIRLARSANSLPGQLKLIMDHVNKGKLLTPRQRQEVALLVDRKVHDQRAAVAPIQNQFGQMARRYGVEADSSFIAPDPFNGIAKPPASTANPDEWLKRKRGGQ